MPADFYDLLEVAPTAPAEEIRAAITRERRVWIRRQASPDPVRRTQAEERVRQLDQAEKTLLDPARRAAFDRQRDFGDRATAPTPPRSRPAVPDPRSPTRGAAGAAGGTSGGAPGEWTRRAQAYLEQGQAGAASRAAQRACSDDPRDSAAWATRGHAALAQGYLDDAEDAFAEAVRLGARDAGVRLGLGSVHLHRSRWERAVADFETVLRERPDDPVARAGIAAAYVHTRRERAGLRLLAEVVRQPPSDSHERGAVADAVYETAVASMGRLRDGSFLALSRRQVAVAERHARWLLQLVPDDPTTQARHQQLRELAREARKAHWLRSDHKRWYALALLIVLLPTMLETGPAAGWFAAVGAVLVVAVYVLRHRRPTWKLRRRELKSEIESRGT